MGEARVEDRQLTTIPPQCRVPRSLQMSSEAKMPSQAGGVDLAEQSLLYGTGLDDDGYWMEGWMACLRRVGSSLRTNQAR